MRYPVTRALLCEGAHETWIAVAETEPIFSFPGRVGPASPPAETGIEQRNAVAAAAATAHKSMRRRARRRGSDKSLGAGGERLVTATRQCRRIARTSSDEA